MRKAADFLNGQGSLPTVGENKGEERKVLKENYDMEIAKLKSDIHSLVSEETRKKQTIFKLEEEIKGLE